MKYIYCIISLNNTIMAEYYYNREEYHSPQYLPKRSMVECFNPNLCLFIPIIHKKINTVDFIKKTIYDNNIGLVYHVDVVKNKNNNNKHYAFVYIRWAINELTSEIQNQLVGNNVQYKFNYTEKRYWILLINNNPKTREELIHIQESILQKMVIKLNNDYFNKIENFSKIAVQNINSINCENRHRSIYTTEFYLFWDYEKSRYIPSINLLKK